MENHVKKGKIKFFNKEKGFGFIIYNNSKQKLFFHISNVDQDDKNLIMKDIDVKFEVARNRKGEFAKNIKILTPKNKSMIPRDTSNLSLDSFDNFHLKLNKFARYVGDKFSFYNTEKRIDISSVNDFNPEFVKTISRSYKRAIERIGYKIIHQSFQPDWRLIVGLGGESVYETSITLHHIYGFPYIPGQAVKGVVRSYFIKTEFEKIGTDWSQINIFEKVLENLDLEKDKKLDYEEFKRNFSIKGKSTSKDLYGYFYKNHFLKDNAKILVEKFQTIFGTQSQQGEAIFFDAYPKTPPNIKIDVMNPHYADYYSGKTPPADYLNPVPIYFLTVEDTEFEFFIGCKKEIEHFDLNETEKLLREALTKHGIGAKTAVGYGYMNHLQ